MTFYTPPAVLAALSLTTYEPVAGSGAFLINQPFAMTEPPPNTLCHTVYADRTIGLTVTAWPALGISGGWSVRFLRRNPSALLLDQTGYFHPRFDGWDRTCWHPVRHCLIPGAALEAVEEWLQMQSVAGEVQK